MTIISNSDYNNGDYNICCLQSLRATRCREAASMQIWEQTKTRALNIKPMESQGCHSVSLCGAWKALHPLTQNKRKKDPEKCTSELNIYRIVPHHTHTTCWHMAHIHKYNIQPVAICFAVFDRCCSDLEINKTTIFQQELISVSAVRAWGLTLTEWLLNLRGAAASEEAARIFLHTN